MYSAEADQRAAINTLILQGTGGRLISVVVMIRGVTLFLRLAQVCRGRA